MRPSAQRFSPSRIQPPLMNSTHALFIPGQSLIPFPESPLLVAPENRMPLRLSQAGRHARSSVRLPGCPCWSRFRRWAIRGRLLHARAPIAPRRGSPLGPHRPAIRVALRREPRCGFVATAWLRLIRVVLLLSPAAANATIIQQAYLKASNPGAWDNFGYSVAISGDTMVVGAVGEDSAATGVNGNQADESVVNSGAAYVFVRSGGIWTFQAYLKASNAGGNDLFGKSVAIDGGTIVVGAPSESSGANEVNGDQGEDSTAEAGAAYVFVRDGVNWSQQAYLKASNAEGAIPGAAFPDGDQFGFSVAISGETVVVGAPFEDSSAAGVNGDLSDNSAADSGAAYVFVRAGTAWSQQAYLKASNPGGGNPESGINGDRFGQAVAVSNNIVVVGAQLEDSASSGVNGSQNDDDAPDSGAAYIFHRNGATWTQEAYLKASNGEIEDYFGYEVAVSGDTVVIAAIGEDSAVAGVNGDEGNNDAPDSGAAYVFSRSGATWTQQAYLKSSNTEANDGFGVALAADGDRLVVSAHGEAGNATGVDGNQNNNSLSGAGAAYVFVREGTNWAPQAYLKASNTELNDQFFRISISGESVVAGAFREDSNAAGADGDQCSNGAEDSGAAYVFDLNSTIIPAADIVVEQPPGTALTDGFSGVDFGSARPGNSLNLHRTFLVGNTGSADLSGLAATISGPGAEDFAITTQPPPTFPGTCGGAPFAVRFSPGSAGTKSAVLHLASNDPDESPFDIALTGTALSSGGIAQGAYVKGQLRHPRGQLGYSVAVSGDTMVAGAIGFGDGVAWVFARQGANWIYQTELRSDDGLGFINEFGYSVAISGDTIAVARTRQGSDAGEVYVFVRSGGAWSQQAKLRASNRFGGDFFGCSVAISGDSLVVGAFGEDSNATGVNGNQSDNSAADSGAVYVFARSGVDWSQQAYLKASNTARGDLFGLSVGITGDTLAVGAPGEDSNATGANGNQSDNSAATSGAVYVFTRIGTVWSQQAYLKASNSSANDWFGVSVSVSADTLAVAAPFEDSSATTVNGNQLDNTAANAGAAYVFRRDGGNWTQQAYLKTSNAEAGDGSITPFALPPFRLGYSVAVSDDMVVLGTTSEDSAETGVNGSEMDNNATSSGAAYVFARHGATWEQRAYLKPSNTGAGDGFGFAVAMSGRYVFIGAPFEDGNATGVNGDETNNSDLNSGAVYMFTMDSTQPSSIEEWRTQHFGSATNSGDGADDADPEGDGLVNFLEFATGSHPREPGAAGTTVSLDALGLVVRYARSQAALANVRFFVEWSDSCAPGSWSTEGVSEVVLTPLDLVQRVEATVPWSDRGQRFVRLRVTNDQ